MVSTRDASPLPEHLRKATWLLFGRQGVLLLGIAVLLLREGGSAVFAEVYRPAYIFLIGASVLNLIFMLLIKWFARTTSFTGIQIVMDTVLASCLVYLTGGVGSNFTPLYFATILSASLLLSATASLLVASICTVLLSAVSLVYFFSYHYEFTLPWVTREWGIVGEPQLSFILAFLLAHTGGFYAVALLSGRLAAGARHIRIMTNEILQNMAGGVIALSSEGTVVYINQGGRDLLGLEGGRPEPMVAVAELLKDASCRSLLDVLMSFTEGRRDIQLPREDTQADLPLQVTTSLLCDDRGRRRGLIAILDDLSLRREMEETKRSIERMEAISEVSASIPHEVRNPLASIRGAIQEVVETEKLGEQSSRLLDLALAETDRLDKIVTDFLQFARSKRLDRKSLNVRRVLEDVADLLRSRKRSADVDVVLDAASDLQCLGDRDHLHQVFLNLGLNGLEALGDRGVLRIEAEAENRMVPGVGVHFVDSGGGVREDVGPRVFEAFWSTKEEGTGLGLSLARRIVLDHGGSIDATNNDEGGATFSVWLPAKAEG